MSTISADEVFRVVRIGNLSVLEQLLATCSADHIKQILFSTRWSGFTVLHRASGLGYTDICEILINNGSNVNSKSIRGWYTPLHIALANGFIETAQYLVDRGANPWTKSKYGEDPFDYGIKRGFKKIVEEFRGKVMKFEMTLNLQRHRDLLNKKHSTDEYDVQCSTNDGFIGHVLSDDENL